MIFYIIIAVLIIAGIILHKTEVSDTGAELMIGVGIVLLVFLLILHPIFYFSGNADIYRYRILKEMYEEADSNNMIDATIKRDIIEYNMILAKIKYWNSTIFDDFIMDEYADLPYIGDYSE